MAPPKLWSTCRSAFRRVRDGLLTAFRAVACRPHDDWHWHIACAWAGEACAPWRLSAALLCIDAAARAKLWVLCRLPKPVGTRAAVRTAQAELGGATAQQGARTQPPPTGVHRHDPGSVAAHAGAIGVRASPPPLPSCHSHSWRSDSLPLLSLEPALPRRRSFRLSDAPGRPHGYTACVCPARALRA